MNKILISLFKTFCFTTLFLYLAMNVFAQDSDWAVQYEPQKVFIENKGQFHIHGSNEPVLFAYNNNSSVIYFTKKGVTYSFINRWSAEKREKKREAMVTSVEEWKLREMEALKMEYSTDVVAMNWVGANPNVEIIPSEVTHDYYSYTLEDKNRNATNINYIKSYKKITYKNLYPNIDVEYIFHPEDGIKYSLILHPGADLSSIKMNYSKTPFLSDNNDIHIVTLFGDIIDHAPLTFYADNHSNVISSKFFVNGNTVSFFISSFKSNKTVIIDPWTQTPSLPNSNGVWECEKDDAGNVYIIGGCMPMKLLKYDASGTLQWTYITPYDTAGNWLGTFITDNAGNSFVTSGSIAALQKINTSGGLEWSAPAPIFNTDEYWNIAFNCDQTKMIIGGTTGNMTNLEGAIFDVNTSNGSVNSVKVVGAGFMFALPPIIEEVRSITSSQNSRYYFLTLDTIGAIDDDFSVCQTSSPTIFAHNSGYNLAYKCENYRPNNGNSGIMAIRANRDFVYTQNGTEIQKRSLTDGSVITTAAIPGGQSTTSLGRYQVGNSGIDIDECGNVYVGSGDRIVKYDANLTYISEIATTYKVSDVGVTSGGNVIFCGTTGDLNSTNRTGTIQHANMSSCAAMTLYCCDANICPVEPMCNTAPSVQLETNTGGGAWSGPGVNPTTGIFDPGIAGPGTHTITYTLPCGSGTITITVLTCATLNVCQDLDGNFVVSGGTGPYNWQTSSQTLDCSGCPMGQCMPPICNGVYVTTWTTYSTGTTGSYQGVVPFRVVDVDNNEFVINDTSLVPSCGSCPSLYFDITSNIGVCPGQTNGSFTVTVNGGASPYDYILLDGGGNPVEYIEDANNTQTFDGLGAGFYTLNIIDNDTCPGSTMVQIQESPEINITLTPANEHCPGECDGTINADITGGGGTLTYYWTGPAGYTSSSANINGLCAGNYNITVTDANSCTKTGSAVISTDIHVNAYFIANPTEGDIPLIVSFNHTGSGIAEYFWNFGDPLSGANNYDSIPNPSHTFDSAGTYVVTLIVTSGSPYYCADTFTVTINVLFPAELVVPNIFTPNGDGVNDEFKMESKGIETFSCAIYNRWGKKIFEWDDITQGWSGNTKGNQPAADGVYYYILYAKGFNKKEYDLHGTVTLMR